MRAAQITRFGDWRTVVVTDAPVPTPGPAEVLVRVAASTINVVGTVESVGATVRGFSPGERVWGIRAGASGMKSKTGVTADYAVVDARRLARAPRVARRS